MFKENQYSKTQNFVPDQKLIELVTGIWYGELPSENSKTSPYKLTLNADYTFIEQFMNTGRSNKVLNNKGIWELKWDTLIVLNAGEQKKIFLICQTDLILLDQKVKRINSPFEKNYHLSKETADYRLNDIWVMQKMTGVALQKEKLPKGLPTFEFHLKDKIFLCNTGTNYLSGEIEITGNHISFNKVVSTRMFCKNLDIEDAIIKTISDKTLSYKIENLKLILEDESGIKMILKKTD